MNIWQPYYQCHGEYRQGSFILTNVAGWGLVLPPDINISKDAFSVVGREIRFGLAAVKNVGKGAINNIISARQKKANFFP